MDRAAPDEAEPLVEMEPFLAKRNGKTYITSGSPLGHPIQGCKKAPVTDTITGYFKFIAACKLLERRGKNGISKTLKIKKEKKIVLIMI